MSVSKIKPHDDKLMCAQIHWTFYIITSKTNFKLIKNKISQKRETNKWVNKWQQKQASKRLRVINC